MLFSPTPFLRKNSFYWIKNKIIDMFYSICKIIPKTSIASGIYLFIINNRNTRTMFEICLKLTIKTPELRQSRRCGVFIDNFE